MHVPPTFAVLIGIADVPIPFVSGLYWTVIET